MKKIVIVFGCLAGIIVATLMFISLAMYASKGNFENGMLNIEDDEAKKLNELLDKMRS